MVLGDRQRLQQVLTNLVANAVKFTLPGGHITVRARTVGPLCEVAVEDDGPGIAPETLPTLFQRYTRAPNAHDGGTGLGLLIVREIIEAHGGSVGRRQHARAGQPVLVSHRGDGGGKPLCPG